MNSVRSTELIVPEFENLIYVNWNGKMTAINERYVIQWMKS